MIDNVFLLSYIPLFMFLFEFTFKSVSSQQCVAYMLSMTHLPLPFTCQRRRQSLPPWRELISIVVAVFFSLSLRILHTFFVILLLICIRYRMLQTQCRIV